jgi:hypothetical protein
MNPKPSPEDLGEPALKVAGLQLWIHGRQFPECDDYDDGNWLRVTAHCGASGASVWVHGSILMVTDIVGFGHECAAMLRGDARLAEPHPIEPELRMSLETADRLGHVRARVDITPDPLEQSHHFEFGIDQSYLPGIIQQCSMIEQEYPVRGSTHGERP